MIYSLWDFLALLVVTLGIALQGVVGIGFALVAAPLLFLIDPLFVPVPLIILGALLSGYMVARGRQHLSWRRLMPALVARVPGSWLGAMLLASVSPGALSLILGGTLFVSVALSWRNTIRISMSTRSLSVAGFFSGIIGTATSVGGPPMALVYQESNVLTARSELAAFFLAGLPITLIMLALTDNLPLESLILTLKMVPGLVAGVFVARRIDRHVDKQSAKPLLLSMSLLGAVLVVVQGVRLLAGAT
ncbi:sulfite exporter TauE/SafE family protein [Marinobacterium rhizophilum]|uniref:Probable membrane transporter protein n=1 Tax=Marinobacterium rhizophilum TaxID=420402 RepID=A0ABY5HJF7_9GAMM|nr:sulfite exporter TauE/SafE family protein [Marinobacterium rhizophilum]UTW12510.1 sulfite exporter TauE/SafE family protein [Marinobacterium rhizophilum]